jgi:transposase
MERQKRNRVYTAEFKQEVMRKVLSDDRPLAVLAKELGVTRYLLYQWRKDYFAARPQPIPAEANPQHELERLRKENAQLRQERDFLKKAAAFFAQNPS